MESFLLSIQTNFPNQYKYHTINKNRAVFHHITLTHQPMYSYFLSHNKWFPMSGREKKNVCQIVMKKYWKQTNTIHMTCVGWHSQRKTYGANYLIMMLHKMNHACVCVCVNGTLFGFVYDGSITYWILCINTLHSDSTHIQFNSNVTILSIIM